MWSSDGFPSRRTVASEFDGWDILVQDEVPSSEDEGEPIHGVVAKSTSGLPASAFIAPSVQPLTS